MGGFGFRSVVLHSEAAYKASNGIFLDPEFSQTQNMLSELLDNKLFKDFLDNLPIEDQIRIKYCIKPHTGAWITAPPLPSFGLSLDHFNFQTICKWWLGLNQPLAAEKCSLCYVPTTPKATHNLACKNGGDLIKRHNKLRNFIFHISQQCGSNPVLEKKNILGDCDSGKRPADVLLPGWSLNKDYAIDVAVTDPINGTFKLDMEACDKYADKYKHDKYDDGFRNTQIDFIPVVFSTFGSLNQEGYTFFKDLFGRNCDSLAHQRCTYIPLLWQKLSILLHKENFKMMSRRFKLSHELSKNKISTMDGIPDLQNEMDQQSKLQELDIFLKERLEESNIIMENIAKISKSSSKKDDPHESQEDYVISELINEENLNLTLEEESEMKQILCEKEDSDQEYDSFPKKGDKIKVKYTDGWYTGIVDSISSKKKHFWADFKGFDELSKKMREFQDNQILDKLYLYV